MVTEELGADRVHTCQKCNDLGVDPGRKLTELERAALEFIIEYNTDRDHDDECVSDLHVALEYAGIDVDGLLGQIGKRYPDKYPHLAPPLIAKTGAEAKRGRSKIKHKLIGKV